MTHLEHSSVHRYFELADSFVEVRVLRGEVIELRAPRRLDRSSYRRLVIQTCMPEFQAEVRERLERLFPDDPMLAEDVLYQLCIEVNPQLEIHKVSLRSAADGEKPAGERRADSKASTPDAFLGALRRSARRLERRLLERVIGQDEAVARVCRAVEKAAAGLAAPDRPLACLLFVGRTGTGKTELARCLSRELFAGGGAPEEGTPRRLVRIDCSEFALAHEYSKLIGSPPGYVGHDEGGYLTEALRRAPESVVLFDEVEKAHPRMHNLLLQVLEEGSLTDGKGRRVSFARSIVILTSNAGAMDFQAATRAVGFHRSTDLGEPALREITRAALERTFAPELLGRIDDVVVFRELDARDVRRIAQQKLTELAVRARRLGARVAFTPAVAHWIAKRGHSADAGARELRRVIQRDIEPPLARLLLEDEVPADGIVRVRVQSGWPAFVIEA